MALVQVGYSVETAMSKSSLLSYSITENVTSSCEMFLQLHGICSSNLLVV